MDNARRLSRDVQKVAHEQKLNEYMARKMAEVKHERGSTIGMTKDGAGMVFLSAKDMYPSVALLSIVMEGVKKSDYWPVREHLWELTLKLRDGAQEVHEIMDFQPGLCFSVLSEILSADRGPNFERLRCAILAASVLHEICRYRSVTRVSPFISISAIVS